MATSIDAVLMAGGTAGSRSIFGRNKLALEIEGIALLNHVLNVLERVERIGRICIVGPKGDIEQLLAKNQEFSKEIVVVEEKENFYENFWTAFITMIPDYTPGLEEERADIRELQVFALSADIPLISAMEINEFLDLGLDAQLDFCLGMTEEKHLEKFLPTADKPGIEPIYLYLREGNFRLNNLHLIKPFKVENRTYIEKLYQRRHQRKFRNIAITFFDVFKMKLGFRVIQLFVIAELSVLFQSLGLESLLKVTKGMTTKLSVSSCVSKLLMTNIDFVVTTNSGSAIDVDSQEEYEIIMSRFREWKSPMP
jgi:GTP:adenosylcobinamide-phosphate guanylyltransferase